MPNNDPHQGRPAWQHHGNEPTAAGAAKLPWQQGQISGQEKQPWSRLSKLIVVTSLLTVALAGVVLVLYLIRPIKPASMLMAGAGYETNLLLPPNVLGWKGLKDIKEWAYASTPAPFWFFFNTQSRIQLLKKNDSPLPLTTEAQWNEFLTSIPHDIKEKTLFIYLSLHGGADDKGGYFLADDDHSPIKLRIEDLFKTIEDRPNLRDKNIIVVLDSPHVSTHWPIDMYQNDFVANLKERYKKTKAANLFIFCACDENQTSWTSEERGSTIFAHFFFEGLRGAADTNGDSRVTLSELEEYVKKNVETWVNQNRNVKQTPLLLQTTRPQDVELVKVDSTESQQSPPLEKEPARAALPESITRDWQDHKDRASWTFAPHVWRRYQDAILRLEYLQRTGSPADLQKKMQDEIGSLNDTLNRLVAIDIDANCSGRSIPLAPALGHPPRAKSEIDKLLANRKNPNAPWAELFKDVKHKPPERQSLRTQLSKRVLDIVTEKGKADFKSEVQWLEVVENELDGVRPVEAHLLVMIDRHADKRLPPNLLLQALQTRCLAETVVLGDGTTKPYSEFIYPWLAENLKTADSARRIGEDWLFGSSEEHWKNAETELARARKKYEEIQKTAALLRRAMATRDRVSAELPYLVHWLALDPDAARDEVEKLPTLAQNLAKLTGDLEPPGADQTRLAAIDALTVKVAKDHERLRDAFHSVQQGLWRGDDILHTRYHQIEAALSVPLISVEQRETLIEKSRRITVTLNRQKPNPNITLEPSEPAAARADRHRKLAEAVYQRCRQDNAPLELVGLSPRISTGLQKSLANPSLADAEKQLTEPVQLARLIPGGLTKPLVDDDSSPGPQQCLRYLRVYHLLMAQAERTLQDHWYDEAGKNTYYVPTAQAYITSAKKLVLQGVDSEKLKQQRLAKSATSEKKLIVAGLSVEAMGDAKKPIDWTTELSKQVKWTVKAGDGVPKDGVPMLWHQIGKAEGTPPRDGVPLLLSDNAKSEGNRSESIKNADVPLTDTLTVELHAYYRGQNIVGSIDVLRRQPDVIVQRPKPPSEAAVAVRMHKNFNYGAVSIILDTSTSMDYKYPTVKGGTGEYVRGTPGKDRRFDYALRALYQVLETIPEGTQLSILNFENDLRINATVPAFVPFGKNNIVPWQIGRLNALKNTLEGIDLTGGKNPNTGKERGIGSPIADAIVQSMKSGFPQGVEPKLTIVLTDGCDTSSVGPQGKFIGNAGVKTLLQREMNANADTNVFVLCFLPEADDDYKTAKEQFSVLPDQFAPRGQLAFQEKGLLLAQEIQEVLRLQLTLAPAPQSRAFPLEVSARDSINLNWGSLANDDYQPSINNKTKSFFDKAVGKLRLTEGQRLFTILQRDNRDLMLERGIIGQQPETEGALFGSKKNKDWLATLFSNVVQSGSLNQVLLLENTRTQGQSAVQQVVPAMVWLEVDPAGENSAGKRPELLRWLNDWSVPAPAYRLSAKGWPLDEKPMLKAWWGDIPTNSDAVKEVHLSLGSGGSALKLGGKTVTIESLSLETDQESKRQCLVVRVKHDAGSPVWIQPLNGSQEAEHQYFCDAGRYTAKFFVNAEPTAAVGFRVLCVNSFKNNKTTMSDAILGDRRIDPPKTFVGGG